MLTDWEGTAGQTLQSKCRKRGQGAGDELAVGPAEESMGEET